MKTLYVFTYQFPYGHVENFLEVELPFLCRRFDRVVIVPISDPGGKIRAVPENCEVCMPVRKGKFRAIRHSISFKTLPFFVKEFFKGKVYSKRSRIKAFIMAMVNVNNYLGSPTIKEILRTVGRDDVFYSYWGKIGSDLWPFVKGRCKLVSRFHGDWDLWGTCEDYAPYRKNLAQSLDLAAFISDKGREFFIGKWGEVNNVVSPLGTFDNGESRKSNDGCLRIVSCSAVYPVKRVDLIFRSLQLIEDIEIEWTHIGAGRGEDDREFEQLKEMVKDSRANIKVNLLGQLTNSQVMDYYSSHPCDVFINLSYIEGVPVSIMEAISYDIPVIATDAGATSEIVTPSTGILLKNNPTEEDVKNAVLKIPSMNLSPKAHWENNYNAERNYEEWALKLYEI